MEDAFKNILIAFILVSLFSLLLLTSVVHQADLYGKDSSEVVGGSLDITLFNESAQSVQGTAENLREKFERQSIFSVVAGVVVTGIFDIAKAMVLMIITPFILVSDIFVTVLGIPAIVVNVFLGILIIGIIFGIWALIKIGN